LNLGLTKTENFIFETKIIGLIINSSSDYSGLKTSLGINPGDDFGISFKYANNTQKKTMERNVTTNVYVEETPIQYITSEGKKEFGFLSVKIW
jgi:hypothetical protein